MLSLTISMKKNFYRRRVCFKCIDFFVLSEENENGDTDAEWKYSCLVLLFFYHYNTQLNKENEQNSVCSISDERLIDKKRDLEKKYISSEVRRLYTLRRYLSIPFNDIRKQSVKLRRTV